MNLASIPVWEGILAHLLGGIIGGVVGWFAHTIYRYWERKRHHAEFDRAITEFARHLQVLLPHEQIPEVMARVVPLASKAFFGRKKPPLKERNVIPAGGRFGCDICKRTIEPTVQGRCPTCKLAMSSYHQSI